MNAMKSWFLAAGVLLGAASAMAQQGAGAGPGPGMGAGMGAGGARWSNDDTPGWSMMTEQERKEHQERMRAMKTYEECKTYADQHREQMSTRAKERGGQALTQARRDPCGGLKR